MHLNLSKFYIILLAFLAGALIRPVRGPAQELPFASTETFEVSSGLLYREWSIEGETEDLRINQLIIPYHIFVPVNDRAGLHVATSNVLSSLSERGDYSLNGQTDGKIRGAYALGDGTVRLNLGINLPTGKNAFSVEEARVGQVLAQHVLGFAAKRFGEGLNPDAGLALARKATPRLVLGGGVAYVRRGAYEFAEGSSQRYKPGDEIFASAGFDYRTAEYLLQVDLTVRGFDPDELDGERIYEEGHQVELGVFFTRDWVESKLVVRARSVFKEKSAFLGLPGNAGLERATGNSTWLQADYRRQVAPRFLVNVGGSASYFGPNDMRWGKVMIYGLGGGGRAVVSDNVAGELQVEWLRGSGERGGATLRGWNMALGVTFRY